MANCTQCGKELPAFSFGEVSNQCPACKQMAAAAGIPAVKRSVYRPPFTVAILAVNVLVFGAMVARGVPISKPSLLQLINWGADFGPLSLGSQFWRILTSNYVHIGVMHFAVNMWALWQLGRLGERIFGGWIFFAIYTATGISGSLLSLWANPMVVSAGASGALFGIMGALIAALYLGKLPIPAAARASLLKNLLWVAGINLYLGATIPGIDNYGHAGGLLLGLALGGVIGPQLVAPADRRRTHERLTLVATAFLLVGLGAYVRQKNGYVAALGTERTALTAPHLDDAIKRLQTTVAHEPNNAIAHGLLGAAYLEKKDYPKAEASLERAHQLDPKDSVASYNLGLAYAAQGQNEQARQIYSELVAQDPDNDDAWVLLGESLDRLNRQPEAVDAYQKATSLNPKNAEAYRNLGLTLIKLNQDDRALAPLEKAAQLDPSDLRTQLALSVVYTQLGKIPEADAARRRAGDLAKSSSTKPSGHTQP